MAINQEPDPIRCSDAWRHKNQQLPPAAVLVRYHGGTVLSGRCTACFRTLAAASAQAILVDVYELGPARTRLDPTSADHDDDPTPADLHH